MVGEVFERQIPVLSSAPANPESLGGGCGIVFRKCTSNAWPVTVKDAGSKGLIGVCLSLSAGQVAARPKAPALSCPTPPVPPLL